MRLSLFFFLHLIAFFILLIVHPHAKADGDNWHVHDFGNYVVAAIPGGVVHGDKLRFFIKKSNCFKVGMLFSFSTTRDIENGPWEKHEFAPSYHDHTLFFEDGKIYMIWGAGEISIVELEDDLSGVKEDTQQVLIENATKPIGASVLLPAEGSQLFKHKGKFYLFNIAWPRNGMRTVIIHRADRITGPYEGRIPLQDKGVALVPGSSFGSSVENYIRISYANSMENLEKAIKRLSEI